MQDIHQCESGLSLAVKASLCVHSGLGTDRASGVAPWRAGEWGQHIGPAPLPSAPPRGNFQSLTHTHTQAKRCHMLLSRSSFSDPHYRRATVHGQDPFLSGAQQHGIFRFSKSHQSSTDLCHFHVKYSSAY